jgi:SulP family sulfate permease
MRHRAVYHDRKINMKLNAMFVQYLPVLTWGRTYTRQSFTNDLTAAIIVTIMLIPQSLAYAMLAGLPPQMGLYASILPITLYAYSAPAGL